jgi:hypothetical protein
MKAFIALVAVFIAIGGSAFAQDGNEKKDPLTTAQALKFSDDQWAQFTGTSEVGQDEAAELYAAAKRLTTEQALGEKDLRLVLQLQNWRQVLSKFRDSIISMAYFVNGGGSMYSHGERRDISAVEDFLTDLSKSLPLADAKGDEKAAKVIDHTISVIKGLKAPPDHKKELADEMKSATDSLTNLKYMVAEIPAAEARKITMFATDGISGWLMNEDEDGKKFEAFRSILKTP